MAERNDALVRRYILAMQRTANAMHPIDYTRGHPRLIDTDPVAHADLVTTMCDLRAAVCIAAGVPVELVDRNGYRPAGWRAAS